MSRQAVAEYVRKRAGLLVAIAVLVEIEFEYALGHESSDSVRIATALAAVAYTAPLAVRRERPGEALIVSGLVGALQGALGLDVMAANGSLLVPLLGHTADEPRRQEQDGHEKQRPECLSNRRRAWGGV